VHARHLVGSFAAIVLHVSSLSAQNAPLRAGNTADVGLGGGLAGVRCESCIPSDAVAMSGFVRVGRVLTPTVIASLEWSRWSRPQFDQQSRFDFVTVGAQWYLIPPSGLWMRYAIGYGRTSYVQMPFEPTVYRTERSGVAYTAGIGYDLHVSDKVVVGPFAAVSDIVRGGAVVNGQPTSYDVSSGLFQYGISVGLR
jgi:hypothetical protein